MLKKILLASLLFSSSLMAVEERTFEKATVRKTYPLGYKKSTNWRSKVHFEAPSKHLLGLPRHFDWRQEGNLSPINDQGNCGDCWAFALTATLQDYLALKKVADPNLSQQFLLSCNKLGYSCNGGFFNAQDMQVNPGAVMSKDFPYQASDRVPCNNNLNHPYKITSWAFIPSDSKTDVPTVDAIKAAIFQYGTVAVGVGANNDFMDYTSGVFNSCDNTQPNHAVALVGWDDDGQYWIMRNSWSAQWGEQGYMRIKWGCNSIGESANYIVVNSTPIPSCTPQAVVNLGGDKIVRRGQSVLIGTQAIAGTTYRWESSTPPNPPQTTSQIMIKPWDSRYYTLYATTKCGTAKGVVAVYVRR